MSWSGAGIPVIGGVTLSGAEAIIIKGTRYLVEHQMPSMEGGIVENLGRPATRIQIVGEAYESGADAIVISTSGFIGTWQNISMPSFNSGYYFINSGAQILFERIRWEPQPGFGYPHYKYILDGVLSGEEMRVAQLSGLTGVTYSPPNTAIIALIFTDYTPPNTAIQALTFTGYTQPSVAVNALSFTGYVKVS